MILGLLGTNALAQTTLSEAVAPGNKVYFQLVNAGGWISVATPEEADFILKVEANKPTPPCSTASGQRTPVLAK